MVRIVMKTWMAQSDRKIVCNNVTSTLEMVRNHSNVLLQWGGAGKLQERWVASFRTAPEQQSNKNNN